MDIRKHVMIYLENNLTVWVDPIPWILRIKAPEYGNPISLYPSLRSAVFNNFPMKSKTFRLAVDPLEFRMAIVSSEATYTE